ncbi:hypothetical protein F4778DRAFT_121507 [Xylariomycetidae sp. FL2044]|nr:hypothetical protein F4778DRAFT_787847 [Xylariomycetidae sp. FL2044]KAH9901698.1 hypothetical protein F4778DRAFT_121492 [Xylariomycetidae sp. FL2044]KAH9901701.1 hypothetical protein F4778DRAFT_121507 [Xylariomycetidae sp. FL2044]
MSRPTPRKYQNRGHQGHPSISYQNQNQDPYSHSHTYAQPPHPSPQRHTRNRSHQLQTQAQPTSQTQARQPLGASDYESDTTHYMATHPPTAPAALAGRSNTELNLSVLKRYDPAISNVLAIAASSVVYTFHHNPERWDRSNVEGAMFVCSRGGGPDQITDDICLFVLSRKSLNNFVVDLSIVSDFEITDKLLIFNLEEQADEVLMENGEPCRPNVIGIWLYGENDADKQTNVALIHELWDRVRTVKGEKELIDMAGSMGVNAASATSTSAAGATGATATGRRISLSEIFGASNGIMGGGFANAT